MVGRQADQAVAATFFRAYSGSGLVIQRLARLQPIPSRVTTAFLARARERLAAGGKAALLLVWDNASWHVSEEVRGWAKAPWLNPIEPKWVHGKRAVDEPGRTLPADAR